MKINTHFVFGTVKHCTCSTWRFDTRNLLMMVVISLKAFSKQNMSPGIWQEAATQSMRLFSKTFIVGVTRKVWLHSSQGYPLLELPYAEICLFHIIGYNKFSSANSSYAFSRKCLETANLPCFTKLNTAKMMKINRPWPKCKQLTR